jgi:Regulator of chromosome condensation (RCC1) repeat
MHLLCLVISCEADISVLLLSAAKNIGGRNLWGPHRITSLKGVAIRTVVSGCVACHCVVITTEGKVYSWGKRATNISCRLLFVALCSFFDNTVALHCSVCRLNRFASKSVTLLYSAEGSAPIKYLKVVVMQLQSN